MRGDSRRDMYSKALALCGLGVLAGAGALVDYWPVSVRFPAASARADGAALASRQPDYRAAAPALADLDELLATTAVALAARPAAARPVHVAPAPDVTVPPSYPALPVVANAFVPGTPLDVDSLPAPVFVSARYQLPVVTDGPTGLIASSAARRASDAFAAPRASAEDDDGFLSLSSAFRKTGSSIVRTGAKTGASLVGAVRVFGSAVRRALPD